MKYHILTYNQISTQGLHRFPSARYMVGKSVERPDAIVLRSHDLHTAPIPATVKAIGRAGSGTNNIPVADMSKRGVPVFNAPGGNANAVKELVFAALLMAARNRLRLVEVPVTMRRREAGHSSITTARSFYYMAKVTIALLIGLFRRRVIPQEER